MQVTLFEAREALSLPYEVAVEFSTADRSFRVDACLRQRLQLQLVDARQGERRFDGVVDRASFLYFTGTQFHFRVRLRPALAALGQRQDCRLYQEMSAVDVAKKVLADAGVEAAKWELVESYEPRELIVQYRESDLAFFHRLLEDEGIFYLFRHTQDGHVMVVADDSGAFVPADDAPAVELTLAAGASGEPVTDFERTRALRTTSVVLRDYDFERPQQRPEASLPAPDAFALPHAEYPGRFVRAAVGERRARARLREERADADVARGRSRAIGLRCGVPFTVTGAAQRGLDGEYVVTELVTHGKQTLESGVSNVLCENVFAAIPAGAPWAPARRTPQPRIRGVQTAVVTGPSHEPEAIHVDKCGRIKVRFHWDRVGGHDERTSPWLRVAQVPQGGAMILPRVGWEQSVAFLEGDPDRPFVLGRVYNAAKVPPYGLPGGKAQGALKSMSSPGGAGHNELMCNDSGGGQGWNLHAQKDLNIVVGHDKTETVGVDEKHVVRVNATHSVGASQSIEVGANQTLQVGAVLSQNVGGSQSATVGGNETSDATANFVEKVGGSRSYKVGSLRGVLCNGITADVAGNLDRQVGTAQVTAAVGKVSDSILGTYDENVGAAKLELVKGTSAETVGGLKSQTSLAAEVHLVKGTASSEAGAAITNLVGGLHYQKVNEYSVKAPLITLLGAVGNFKGGGSVLKLGGGPVVLKGDKIVLKGAMLVKMGGSLKMGPG
ncbi:MAG: type VI secretion system tip protein VgrG [Deltaproteobacteria bacterium]|nr:type VI secretion system tip protein VgrG [Deltaproteobacteria bacterium]